MSDWRLPRSTSSLMGDWMAVIRAHPTATTDEQRAAVLVRVESLAARDRAGERMTELDEAMAVIATAFKRWLDQIRPPLEEVYRMFVDAARHLEAEPAERRGARPHLVIVDETTSWSPPTPGTYQLRYGPPDVDPIARARARRSAGPPLPPLDPRRRRR